MYTRFYAMNLEHSWNFIPVSGIDNHDGGTVKPCDTRYLKRKYSDA